MRKILFICHFFWLLATAHAQPDIDRILNVDSTWVDYIHSVELKSSARDMPIPVLYLDGSQKLTMGFDDSYGDFMDYYYTIYHCTKDWKVTEVEKAMYLEGQDEVEIENYGPSILSNKSYYHYSFTFPNQDVNIRWSGNYMLVVYDNDGTVIISKRFYVVENIVELNASFTYPYAKGTYLTHQALDISIDVSRLNPRNPVEDISITAWQNQMNEDAITDRHADYYQGSTLKFNKNNQLSFEALKEHRRFDLRTLQIAGENVASIDLNNTQNIVILQKEKNRRDASNFYVFDINGDFFIENRDPNANNPHYTGKYSAVNFVLETGYELQDEIYVLGEFNDYKITPKYKMEYMELHKSYFLEVELKQGYYNYLFGVKNEKGQIDYTRLEGSNHDTGNDYHIFTYYSPLELDYDRIINYRLIKYDGNVRR